MPNVLQRAFSHAARGRDPRRGDAPTPDDLPAHAPADAARVLDHLAAERAAGRMRCYTYLRHDDAWGWHVTLEELGASATPDAYRLDLRVWAARWLEAHPA